MKPHRDKIRIAVLGNHKDCYWKIEKYVPVLFYSSLRQLTKMSIEHHHHLCQGGFKNYFCNTILPDNETTIIKPPIGCPFSQSGELWLLKKKLQVLQLSPCKWFENSTITFIDIGVKYSPHDTSVYTGTLTPWREGHLHWSLCGLLCLIQRIRISWGKVLVVSLLKAPSLL